MKSNDKSVCFAYVSKDNRKFLESTAKKSGQSMSFCLDQMIESIRTKKAFKIEKQIPKYVRDAKKWAERNPQLAS